MVIFEIVFLVVVVYAVIIFRQKVNICHRSESRGWHKQSENPVKTLGKRENPETTNHKKCYPLSFVILETWLLTSNLHSNTLFLYAGRVGKQTKLHHNFKAQLANRLVD